MRITTAALCAALFGVHGLSPAGTITTRVSVDSAGNQGDNYANIYPTLSADGRFVAFASIAANLVPNDTNAAYDIFVRDRATGQTTRVNVGSSGVQADSQSLCPLISLDGRFVIYTSFATNLVPGDTNGLNDGFLFDRQTGVTTRLTVGAGGVEAQGISLFPVLSADGRYCSFMSDAGNLVAGDNNGVYDAFVRDLLLDTITRVSVDSAGNEADGRCYFPTLSLDGRYVAFPSDATNLVPGDTNGATDIFRRDLLTQTTERVSVSTGGAQASSISDSPNWAFLSADGRFVVFESDAADLVPGDTNAVRDIFLRDLSLGVTSRLSLDALGVEGNGDCNNPTITPDGRFVAFESGATNLVPGDTNAVYDVFVRDLQAGTIRRISVSSSGTEGSSDSFTSFQSADGRHIAYYSDAPDLVAGDTNAVGDVFVFTDCWVLFQTFGTATAGTGGIAPVLSGDNGPCVAGGHSIAVSDVLGGAAGILFIGVAQADQFPVFGGHFYVSLGGPFLSVLLPVGGLKDLPGDGSFAIPGADVSTLVGIKLYLQYLAADPGAVQGVSMTNGLELKVVN